MAGNHFEAVVGQSVLGLTDTVSSGNCAGILLFNGRCSRRIQGVSTGITPMALADAPSLEFLLFSWGHLACF
jgi:hypothetical protein